MRPMVLGITTLFLVGCAGLFWPSEETYAIEGSGVTITKRTFKSHQEPTHGSFFGNTWFHIETSLHLPDGRTVEIENSQSMHRPREEQKAARARDYEIVWMREKNALLVVPDDTDGHGLLALTKAEAPPVVRHWLLSKELSSESTEDAVHRVIQAYLGAEVKGVRQTPLTCNQCAESSDADLWNYLNQDAQLRNEALMRVVMNYALQQVHRNEALMKLCAAVLEKHPKLGELVKQTLARGDVQSRASAIELAIGPAPRIAAERVLQELQQIRRDVSVKELQDDDLLFFWLAARIAKSKPSAMVAQLSEAELSRYETWIRSLFTSGSYAKKAGAYLVLMLGDLPTEAAIGVLERLKPDSSASSGSALIPEFYDNPFTDVRDDPRDLAVALLDRRAKER